MIGEPQNDGEGPRYFGLYPAIVTNIVDSENLGRIEVKLPWLGESSDGDVRAWATLLTPYADDGQGLFVLPAVETQVVVAFEAGDLRRPYIVGACWNGKEKQPEQPAAANNKRLIRTRAKSLLEFDDTEGAAKVTLSLDNGNQVVLEQSPSTITIQHSGGAKIVLEASGRITISATSTVEVQAAALNVHCPTATFDGIVNCQSLIASTSVISPLYNTAVGNFW